MMHDYNKEGSKIVLLLHPMLANGEMMYELLGKYLGEDVRCLAPDFAAHGDKKNKEFKSAAEEVEKILNYLKDNGIEHIDLAFGASLGGVVLTQLLRTKKINCSKVFFEGASFFEDAGFLMKVVASKFLKKQERAAADRDRAIEKMGELYGKAYAEDFADQFIGMTELSIRNIAKCCGTNVHADLSKEEQENCVFAYGSKDLNVPKAKAGCKKYYPYAKLVLWDNYEHCEKITADTEEYIKTLKSYLV